MLKVVTCVMDVVIAQYVKGLNAKKSLEFISFKKKRITLKS